MRQFSTPMMQQYAKIKEQYSDCLLFFRLGDFYELFLDDAVIGAEVLDIVLTKRPRGKDGHIPMAGVPYHASDHYIAKLVKAGHKVAICEQMSEPDNRSIVERDVVRIVTPGTILDEKTLTSKEHNYTMSLSIASDALGIAVCDVSTGDFQVAQIPYQDSFTQVLLNELTRFPLAECIVNETTYTDSSLLKLLSRDRNLNTYCFADWDDCASNAKIMLTKHFQVTTLESFGLEKQSEAQKAAASLLGYISHTQKEKIGHITTMQTYAPTDYVRLDNSTIANLELFTTIREQEHNGSLLSVLDHTQTAMGGRLLRAWLRKPLTDKKTIEARLQTVDELLTNTSLRKIVNNELQSIYDIERILSRLSVGIGNAHDLIKLKQSFTHAQTIQAILKDSASSLLGQHTQEFPTTITDVIAYIEENIVDDPPADSKQGGIFRTGIDSKLDVLRKQAHGGRQWISEFETAERKRSGIQSLKVKFNQVFGYYIEISKANLTAVPDDYHRKQTMVNAERFITPILKEYEEKVLTAQEHINRLEYQLLHNSIAHVLEYTDSMQQAAHTIATLDCLVNFATVAEKQRYTKPIIVDDGQLELVDSRHPVVETLLDDEPFVPNDVRLHNDDQQLIVMTGPNMAGKSVYIRQVALAVLLTHIGCFVPATEAKISLVDSIFVRSGASDVITSGLSTFMVEMVETAHILTHATNKSLIVMDEIGRGTSTYDGISIAWAVAEYLVTEKDKQAKTLFATHYHELQALAEQYPDRIKNYQVAVENQNGKPLFLHKVIPGSASHSHGIAVAEFAGVPKSVVARAKYIMSELEKRNVKHDSYNLSVLVQNPTSKESEA